MLNGMKVGIVHFMAYPETIGGEGPIVETLRKIAQDDFFDLVEVTWIKDDAASEETRRLLQEAHLEVAYGAQPCLLSQKLDLNAPDEAERKKAIDQVEQCINEAYYLGARALSVLSGKDPGEGGRERAFSHLVTSLTELCAYSAERSSYASRQSSSTGEPMPIILETFDQVPFGKNCLIGPTKEAVRVAEAVKKEHPNFGLMIDLSHLPLLGESTQEALGLAKDHLLHVHIGNCIMKDSSHPAYGDSHPRFGCEGGENDVSELAEFLKVLKEIGYLGRDSRFVSFEVMPMKGESSELVIAGAKRTLQHAWAKVQEGI
jgi:sugar phosphate isomerase/epimerase